jgi:hypothetical protein
MNPVVTSKPFPLLSSTVRQLAAFVLVATLFITSACAQGPATPTTPSMDAKAALQPYLGKWRPTSYSEGLNIGSLSISENGLSVEVGGSLTYEVVRKTDEGIILRVTGRTPPNAFPSNALAFSLETHTITSFPPGGPTKTRQDLWIYWCSSLERLASGISKASCSKNGYMR